MTGRPDRPVVVSPLVAWALVSLVVAALWAALVEPLLTMRDDLAAEADAARRVVSRQTALVAGVDDLERRLARGESVLAASEAGLFAGAGADGAAALQRHLRQAASAAGMRIDSIGVPPTEREPDGPYAIVSVTAIGAGTIAALQGLLHGLESGRPWIRIDRLSISRGAGGDDAPLAVDLAVSSIAAADGTGR